MCGKPWGNTYYVPTVPSLRSSVNFGRVCGTSGRPLMVCASTTKGKGVSYMENVPIWHYRSPNKQEYQQATVELERMAV